ncbi:MAG TPA: hypothetical protein VF450_13365 [Noviherbaspirillum sp.]
MNYKLDKLVGRDPLPGDEVAFDRVTRLFARARQMQPAVKKVASRKSRPAPAVSARKVAV